MIWIEEKYYLKWKVAQREREREFYGLKQYSWSKANGERRLVMCRAVAVGGGGGDLPDEGEIGRRQQWEGAARGGWETNESRGEEGGRGLS